jgi:hypothetical protein
MVAGVFLDRKLNFQNHHNIIIAKAREGRDRVRSITRKLGLNPENAKKVQIAAVQSVARYGAGLWWDGHVGKSHGIQTIVNTLARRCSIHHQQYHLSKRQA